MSDVSEAAARRWANHNRVAQQDAARAMLVALKDCVSQLDPESHALEVTRAAIAQAEAAGIKAEGESNDP